MAAVLIPFTVVAALVSTENREVVLAGGATLSFITFLIGV